MVFTSVIHRYIIMEGSYVIFGPFLWKYLKTNILDDFSDEHTTVYCHNISALKFTLVVVIMIVWNPSCITFIGAYSLRINK